MKIAGRKRNVSLNIAWALIGNVVTIILGFFSRRVFISYLGTELLGVNSLFADVLLLFSFADLGIGNAIMFSMYRPIAEKNTEYIKSLLLFYKKIYRYVIGALILISMAYIPFMPFLKTDIPIKRLLIYYIFFQFNNMIAYFWAYRENYVIAIQRERFLTILNMIFNIIINISQIAAILLFSNFILYLSIGCVIIFLKKIIINKMIVKRFPITKLEEVKELNKEQKKDIITKAFSLCITKIGNLIINQTDGLIVAYVINVYNWGLIANYLMIKKAIVEFCDKIYSAMLPSIGNLLTENDQKKEEKIFLEYDLINTWIHTVFFVSLACLSTPLIEILFGKNLNLAKIFVFTFFLAMFIDGLRAPVSAVREACGLYKSDKWYTIVAAVVNLISSYIFAKKYGITGVYIGTILAMLVLHFSRAYILFVSRHYIYGYKKYMLMLGFKIVVAVAIYLVEDRIINYIEVLHIEQFWKYALMLLSVIVIPNGLFILFNFRNKYYLEIKTGIKCIIKKEV